MLWLATLTLTGGKDGHFDYTFKPAPDYEDKPLEIELSVKDHDGDTATGTIGDRSVLNTTGSGKSCSGCRGCLG